MQCSCDVCLSPLVVLWCVEEGVEGGMVIGDQALQATGGKGNKGKGPKKVDLSNVSDEELAALIAQGLDLNTGLMPTPAPAPAPTATAAADTTGPSADKSGAATSKPPGGPKGGAPKGGSKAAATTAAATSGSEETRGLRGKPYLLRDGDVLVVVDLRDCPSAALYQDTEAWSPPPAVLASAGGGSAGMSDVQRAIEASLREESGGSRVRAPEVGVHIDVDV
jgi:hypothetical protein